MKYKELFDLKNRVAVVTGGAGLIGKEFTRVLAENGAVSVIADTDKKDGKQVEEVLRSEDLKVFFRCADIGKLETIIELIKYIDKKWGRIDIWINNAYPRTSDWGMPIKKTSIDSWRKNIDMHMNGYCLCSRAAAEYMKKNGIKGTIINISSIYGVVGPTFSIYEDTMMTIPPAYSAIKGGVISFTKYLACYYGKYGIRINCISPGGIYDNQSKKFVKNYERNTPLGRMAQKEDIVGALLYLASDASIYVTGHNLIVDGGWVAK